MQRILSVYDWQHLPEGSQFSVSSDIEHQRSVRLRVNAPGPMALYVNQAEFDVPVLLAHVVGLDEIQFEILGDYAVMADGGDCFFDTLDGTKPFVESVDNASFTQIVERRVRNPELEAMENRMYANMQRNMAQLAAELALANAERDRAYANAQAAPVATPVAEQPGEAGALTPEATDPVAVGTTPGENDAAS